METLSRQWKYFLLDVSAPKDVGELSSKVLFADAGDREVMDRLKTPSHVIGRARSCTRNICLVSRLGTSMMGSAEDARLHARKPRRVSLQTSSPGAKESLRTVP